MAIPHQGPDRGSHPERTSQNAAAATPDIAEIRRALAALIPAGQVTELRALHVPDGKRSVNYSGYYDDPAALARDALKLSQMRAEGVYIILNTVDPDLLARAVNRYRQGEGTTDSGIIARRYLQIDVDPARASGISSNDEQHELALGTVRDIAAVLHSEGWPEPIIADSGNGGHLLYRIDLPNDEAARALVKRCLEALAFRIDDARVSVDVSCSNAARIWKLYGTVARKGDHTPARPHRLARILSLPAVQIAVDTRQLEALAATLPEPEPQPTRGGHHDGPTFDLHSWIARHALPVHGPLDWEKGEKWVFDTCPWNAEHTNRAAYIVQFASGAIAAGCLHNSCRGNHWRELRALYDGPAPERVHKPDPTPGPSSSHQQRTAPDPDPQPAPDTRDGMDELTMAALLKYDADDNGNAEAMTYLYGRRFLFTPAYGWLRWTGTHWSRVPEPTVAKYAIRTLKARRHAAVEIAGHDDVLKAAVPSANKVAGCLTLFRSYVIEKSVDVFDADPDLLNCRNGVLDMRSGTLTPHDPSQRFTYCVPVDFDPAADMAAWESFIFEALGRDEEKIRYFQTCVGYSLTGHTRDEKMFYLYGPPRAGKGTVSETLLALLPHPLGSEVDFNSFTARRDNDNQNFDLAELKPARMVFASESNRYQSLNPAKIKQITGGNYVRCAFKHKDMFTYRPQFKVWLVSNHKVRADADDDALWGRVQVFTFPHSHLGNEDVTLKERMKSHDMLPGVLRWALQGAQHWYRVGRLTPPEAVMADTREHRSEQDYIAQWLADCCELHAEKSQATWTGSTALYGSYRAWCETSDIKPLRANEFADTLVNRFGCVAYRWPGSGLRGYQGVTLRESGVTPPDDSGVTPHASGVTPRKPHESRKSAHTTVTPEGGVTPCDTCFPEVSDTRTREETSPKEPSQAVTPPQPSHPQDAPRQKKSGVSPVTPQTGQPSHPVTGHSGVAPSTPRSRSCVACGGSLTDHGAQHGVCCDVCGMRQPEEEKQEVRRWR